MGFKAICNRSHGEIVVVGSLQAYRIRLRYLLQLLLLVLFLIGSSSAAAVDHVSVSSIQLPQPQSQQRIIQDRERRGRTTSFTQARGGGRGIHIGIGRQPKQQKRNQKKALPSKESSKEVSASASATASKKVKATTSVVVKTMKRSSSSSSSFPTSSQPSSPLLVRLKIGFYFGLWYALNIYYNIINKKLLNVLPLPWTIGSLQLGVGSLYVLLLWLLHVRPFPTALLHNNNNTTTAQVGFWHAAGQLCSMVSLGAGPVSFTHIVKALEPFFSALVSVVVAKEPIMAGPVYATLLPVVGGVAYACLQERQFSMRSFIMAMGSNVAFALRAVLSKQVMSTMKNNQIQLSSSNLFGMVTVLSFLMAIPMAILAEGRDGLVLRQWTQAITAAATTIATTDSHSTDVTTASSSSSPTALVQAIIITGLFHYLNNEVMYLALGNVHPVTLAVGNTMKRVFIIITSVLVFRNPITLQAAIGSGIGISGVLLYSLTKQYYESKSN